MLTNVLAFDARPRASASSCALVARSAFDAAFWRCVSANTRHERDHQQDRGPDEKPSQSPVLLRRGNRARLALRSFPIGELTACGEELAFGGAERDHVGDVVGRDQSLPTVQHRLVAALLAPFLRRDREAAPDSDGVAIFVDPLAQAGPFAQERLVRDLDRWARG